MPKNDNISHASSRHVPRRIVCVETGEVYDGAEAAARALGIPYGGSNIRTAAQDGGLAKGYHWRFEDDDAAPNEVRGNKAVVCWETGEQFGTAEAAAKWAGCSSDAIYAAVRLRNTAGDHHWYLACNARPDESTLKFSKKVVCWETGTVFSNSKDAAEFAGVSVAVMRGVIKRGGVAAGMHWHYEGEPTTAIEETMANKVEIRVEVAPTRPRPRPRPKRAVTCWETGEKYDSTDSAGAAMGVKGDSIAYAARNGTRSAEKHWYWSDEPRPTSFDESKRVNKPRPGRAVVCWETDEVFDSTAKAAEAVRMSRQNIINAIARKGTCGGYHWYWADEPRPDSFAPRKRSGGNGRPKRAVVCWETGEVYSCAQEAAEAVGLKSATSICIAVKKGAPAGGYRWYYEGDPKPDESELKKPSAASRHKAVVCAETGEVYPTITAAARAMGRQNRDAISAAVRNGGIAYGRHWHWHWHDDPAPVIAAPVTAEAEVEAKNAEEHADECTGDSELRGAEETVAGAQEPDGDVAVDTEPAALGSEDSDGSPTVAEIAEVPEEEPVAVDNTKAVQVTDPSPAAPMLDFDSSLADVIRWVEAFGYVMDSFGARCQELARLNATQSRLLLGCALVKDKPVSHIADMLAIKRSAASYALGGLEKQGLVTPVAKRRFTPAELTAEGEQHCAACFAAIVSTFDEQPSSALNFENTELLSLIGSKSSLWKELIEAWVGAHKQLLAEQESELGGMKADTSLFAPAFMAVESMFAFAAQEKTFANAASLSPAELHAVCLLAVSGSLTATELGERTCTLTGIGTSLVKELRKKELIDCAQRASDKRVTDISLTDHGRELIGQIGAEYTELFQACFPGLDGVSCNRERMPARDSSLNIA